MIDRTVGDYLNISIGTALAFEGLMDAPTGQIEAVYINLRTIVRNYLSAYEGESMVGVVEHKQILNEELVRVEEIIRDQWPKMRIHFYVCTYRTIQVHYPHAKHRTKLTLKQQTYADLEQDMISAVHSVTYEVLDTEFKAKNERVLLLTHYPLDLISARRLGRVTLLESHTGKLKPRTEWITKITRDEKQLMLPFNRATIQILGDKNILFRRMGRDIVTAIVDLGLTRRWTRLTTIDKMIYDIRKIRDPYLSNFLINLTKGK